MTDNEFSELRKISQIKPMDLSAAKAYQDLEAKTANIYKLSGMTLDDIVRRFMKGDVFVSYDLIKYLKAEIETLKAHEEKEHQYCKNVCEPKCKAEIERLEKVQVQYVKAYFDEFAERLKNDFRLAQLDIGLTSAVVDELVETMNNEFNTLADFTDLIKAEAVKEVIARAKEYFNPDISFEFRKWLDSLEKELVGED